MLLSEALGGDSKTTLCVTAGAEDQHALETLQVHLSSTLYDILHDISVLAGLAVR